MDRKGLEGMTLAGLRSLARERKVPIKKKMKRSDVIEALAGTVPPARGPVEAPEAQGQPESAMRQAVEQSKYYTGPPVEAAWVLPGELPRDYNDDKIALMGRDPHWAYAYWEVTPKKIEAGQASLDGADAHLAIRVYDVTGVVFNGMNAHSHNDIGVFDRVGSWYLDVVRPGRSFVADLGLKARDGRFVTLARSNSIRTPKDGVSEVLDEEWVLPESGFDRIFALSGGYGGIGMSSAEVRLAAAQRVPFGVASPGISSLSLMSPIKKRERGFWFVLNTELIVYGATEPDARVTVQGRQIDLRPDGTFTLRFALPDGTQVIPVSATSSDLVETRWITPTVNRDTAI